MARKISEQCAQGNCMYYEVGSLGTEFCAWCSERCPEEGCYKEEQEKREMNGEAEYFFAL